MSVVLSKCQVVVSQCQVVLTKCQVVISKCQVSVSRLGKYFGITRDIFPHTRHIGPCRASQWTF